MSFIVPAIIIIWAWAAADLAWPFIIPSFLILTGGAAYAYVLARRGQ